MPADAGPPAQLLATHLGAPWGLAVDGDGVLVTMYAGGGVARIDASGNATRLVAIAFPSGVAVGGTSIFVGANAGAARTDGTIVRVDRASGTQTVIAVNQPNPRTLAIAGDYLYWVNGGTYHGIIDHDAAPNHDASLVRIPLAGGTPEVLYDGEDAIEDLAIDGDTVYVAATHSIVAVPAGGKPHAIADDERAGPYGIAAHAGSVYWTLPLGCAVRAVSPGGTPATLATDENVPYRIAADADGIAWTNYSRFGRGFAGSSLVVAAADGSDRRVIAAAQAAFALAFTSNTVYFTSNTLDGDVAVAPRK